MRLTNYFLPVLKESPSDAEIVSHQLMMRAGMISQSSSGIYSWLPLGLRVLKKIENIVREEQDAAGVNEILMPTIQPADLWKESGRYEDYGKEMLRINDRQDREMLYGPTNEEQVTDIFRRSIKSYKELPQLLYHIQWKFRDELMPVSKYPPTLIKRDLGSWPNGEFTELDVYNLICDPISTFNRSASFDPR